MVLLVMYCLVGYISFVFGDFVGELFVVFEFKCLCFVDYLLYFCIQVGFVLFVCQQVIEVQMLLVLVSVGFGVVLLLGFIVNLVLLGVVFWLLELVLLVVLLYVYYCVDDYLLVFKVFLEILWEVSGMSEDVVVVQFQLVFVS